MSGHGRPDLPVVIVGGLHADARRAAVARLLADVPGSVVLHHDLATAAAGTVVRTVRDATGVLSSGEAPLVNDCACCALREDLVPELERLARAGGTPLAVVELWDSVEPKAMAEVVTAGGFTVTGVITAVDPALVLPYLGNGDDLAEGGLAAAATDQRTVADTFARQLEYAPSSPSPTPRRPTTRTASCWPSSTRRPAGSRSATATRRAPPAGAGGAGGLRRGGRGRRPAPGLRPAAGRGRRARRRHPGVAQPPALPPGAALRGAGGPDLRGGPQPRPVLARRQGGHVAALGRRRGALCVESAGPWLASLPDAAWEMVPPVRRAAAALDWHPEHGDRCQHLVFTSPGLDRDGLERLLESCLLTDAEYAAGRAAWERLPSAFDTLLEV